MTDYTVSRSFPLINFLLHQRTSHTNLDQFLTLTDNFMVVSFFFFFFFFFFFLAIEVFFHDHSRITELQEKREGIYLTPHYHFHPIHRHLDISQVITEDNSPLHIGSSRTQAGRLWFLIATY